MRKCFSNRTQGRGLVSMSASMLCVETCTISKMSSLTQSRTKWYLASICFVLAWCSGLFARASAPSLSTWNGRADLGLFDSSVSMLRSQRPSLQESANALYSALVLDRDTVACLQDFQEIAPSPNLKV